MDIDFSWLDDLKEVISNGVSASSKVVKNLDSDDYKNIANVVGTIGQYESAKMQQKQFDDMMDFKMKDYNRSVDRQNEAQNNLNIGIDNVFGKTKVDCTLNPLHPDCL